MRTQLRDLGVGGFAEAFFVEPVLTGRGGRPKVISQQLALHRPASLINCAQRAAAPIGASPVSRRDVRVPE